MANTSIQWNDTNYLDISQLTPEASQNASVSNGTITFTGVGFITFKQHWEYTGDANVFNTPYMRLSMLVNDPTLVANRYRSDIIVSIGVTYWVKGQETYAESDQTMYNIIPAPASTSDSFGYNGSVQLDESKFVATLTVTFRCTQFLQQSISQVVLNRAVSINDTIRNEINSSLARGQLTKVDFYTDGFTATFESSTLSYKYLVQDGQLVGLIHQPTGFTVTITQDGGPMPE